MSGEIERFTEVAREFCALLETATQLDLREFRTRLLHVLPALYLAGANLPQLDVDADVEHVPLELDLLVALSKHLGDHDGYWEVFDPTQRTKPVKGLLSADLSEIRFDRQQGLLALERGTPLEEVVWEWRFGFENHWGEHLVDALRAIHWQAAW
jgi:Domain of unknown function (DUF5063)